LAENERAKILLISPVVPYPPDQRSRVILLSLINALRDEFELTVLARALSKTDLEYAGELESQCDRVVAVMAPHRKSFVHRAAYRLFYQLKSMILRRSLKKLYDCQGVLVRTARELSREHFDLVIISFWQLSETVALFPSDKTLLITPNIDLLVNPEISRLERNLVKKIQAVRKWLREQPEELAAYRSSRHVWTLTAAEKSLVEKICWDSCSVDVMPFGIDVDFFAPSGMQRNKGEVLFLGHLDEPVNLDALDYFVRKIYPHVDDVEGLSITIVGGNLPSELKFFGLLPEVEVVGRVSDVRPYLHRASCLVAPLRFGGGLRIRILEAMAAGLPVVAGRATMSAMPFEKDQEFLAADKPEDYANQIRRVLGDEPTAARLSQEASRGVRERFASTGQARRVVAMVRQLVVDAGGA
jgi:glycosyltransferase involved in cell wall biosynthesis